uniref:Uncharacterized protein n=1 Tax=Anopheles atroparvus TaxID=41427 RepID=A0A182JCX2_ANOAO
MSCGSCKLTIGDDAISCDGPCGSQFHISCLDLPRECIKELRRNPQLLWLCRGCTATRCSSKGSLPPCRDDIAVHVRSCLSSEFAASFNGLRSELLGEIKSVLAASIASHQVAAHVPTQASTQPTRPSTPAWNAPHATGLTNVPSKRRLIDRSPPPAVKAPPLLTGTGQQKSRALLMVPPAEAKFWLYLTRIAPSVPIADVEAYVREQLGTDDVTVVR